MSKIDQILVEVKDELLAAQYKFIPFRSEHEGYAIIKEEVDELWDEVKKQPKVRDKAKLRTEARQIAAMAIRFMLDLTEEWDK